MLCSVPSSGKGGSKWLERLRSNKGFDNVLDSSTDPPRDNSSTDNSPCPCENPKAAAAAAASSSSSSSFAVITGILSDLFYITPASSASSVSGNNNNKKQKKKKKKFPRKQSSPKILSNQQPPPPPPPLILSSNSHNAHQQHSDHEDDNPPHKQLLPGFSKTELTVIDTSSDLWKSDKLIFRRKHVWKIKDKTNPHQQIQEYNAEHCSGPEMSANAPDSSSNGKKENAFTPLQENGSYDPEKKW